MRFKVLIPLLFLISPAFGQAIFQQLISSHERVAPVVSSITVSNATPNLLVIQLTDNSTIDTQVPDAGQWTIIGTTASRIVTAQVVDPNLKTIELSIDGNITDADTPLLTYVNPGDDTGIRDIYFNYLASFSNTAVTNNTGIVPVFSGNANLQRLFASGGYSGTSTILDASGNGLTGLLLESHCLTSDGTTVLTFSSLSGITITSWEGTSTLAKSGNTITTTSGTFYNVLLSNGTRLRCAEGSGSIAYDAVNSLNGTLTGTVDWTGLQDTFHGNIRDGFSFMGVMDANNQYVALTTSIPFSTTKFAIQAEYAPVSITVTQDIFGTATTSNRLEIAVTAGAIAGTLRLGSGTTYTLSCADTPATINYANNTFCIIILARDVLGNVTLTINGFPILINGSASVVDASSTTFTQLMRTSTSNGTIGILKEVEILDAATASLIGTKYNAGNGFLGTLQGGFTLRKYPKPVGGDVANRNLAGNWHNAAETKFKPNPTNDATYASSTGYDNTTKLTYANLASLTDPVFANILDPLKRRNFTVWTTALAYVDEKVANAYVGKTSITLPKVTGFSGSNYLLNSSVGSSYAATLDMTVKIVVVPTFVTTSQLIFGKTNAISGNDWGVYLVADASGSGLSLVVRDGSNAVVHSRYVTFSEKEDDISIYHFVIRSNGVGGYEMLSVRNGHIENTHVSISGLTTSTSNLVLGAFSSGNGFAGGIVAVALYNHGMTDNEIEASYQATKNNVYTQEDNIVLLYGSESGNANWDNRVTGSGGSPTLTKTGTLTSTTFTEAFNYRWRPEDWPSTTTASGLSTLTAPEVRGDGDSRTVSGTVGVTTNGLYTGVRTLTLADPDISGTTYIGSEGAAPVEHYGLNGEDSDGLLSTAPGIVSVNGTYPADIIVNFVGTNATTSEVLFDREVNEWEGLMRSYNRDIAGVRYVVIGETEHDDANRRARLQDLMYQKMIIIERLRELGYNIIFVNPWRVLKHQDGDFIDVVHPNDQGNGKLAPLIYQAIRLSTNHNSIPWLLLFVLVPRMKRKDDDEDYGNGYKMAA